MGIFLYIPLTNDSNKTFFSKIAMWKDFTRDFMAIIFNVWCTHISVTEGVMLKHRQITVGNAVTNLNFSSCKVELLSI